MNLTDIFVKNIKPTDKTQKIADGSGLYLHVSPAGGKLWRMPYRFGGKQKTLTLGSYPIIPLKDARKRCMAAKEMLANGIDPNAEKKRAKAEQLAKERDLTQTFAAIAGEWYEKQAPSYTHNYAKKMKRFLEKEIFPIVGDMLVSECHPTDFLKIVQPAVKAGHNETAHKIMRLCGQVMRYAVITGRLKYNVAAGLSEALPPVKVTHRAAITDPKAIGQLLRDIDAYTTGHYSVVYCLKILPYVFTRPSELRLAEWPEFNFEEKLWRIPVGRMKMRRAHVVPLADQVIALLRELQYYTGEDKYLFPSIRTATAPISDVAPLAALRRLGYTKGEACLHGFRATASTRLNEMGFRGDVIEAQLAHQERDGARLAYNHAEYMEERRKMMQAWADYLDELKAKV